MPPASKVLVGKACQVMASWVWVCRTLMSEPIVCKPTPWFLLRAAAMIAMFGVFAVLFYVDATTGYRAKNLSHFAWRGVEAAASDFASRQDQMTPEQWQDYASQQKFELPEDRSILPEGTPNEIAWPSKLQDFETMKAGLANQKTLLFEPSMDELGLTKAAPEHEYDAGKIREQWIVFWICLVLTLIGIVILIRTLCRKMVVDGGKFQPAGGKPVQISDLNRLDLRKWNRKGLAFVWAKVGDHERKIRIDGLTYGGFKKENDQPAEMLLNAIKAKFSGEIIDYEQSEPDAEPPTPPKVD